MFNKSKKQNQSVKNLHNTYSLQSYKNDSHRRSSGEFLRDSFLKTDKTLYSKFSKHVKSKTNNSIKSSSMVGQFMDNAKNRHGVKHFSFIRFVSDRSQHQEARKLVLNKTAKEESLNYFTGKFSYKFNNPFNGGLKQFGQGHLNTTKKSCSALTGHGDTSKTSKFQTFLKTKTLLKTNSIQSFGCHLKRISGLESYGKGLLASSGEDGLVKTWNIFLKPRGMNLEGLQVLRGHCRPVSALCSGDGLLISGDTKGQLNMFKKKRDGFNLTRRLEHGRESVVSLDYDDNLNMLLSTGRNTLKLFDFCDIDKVENFVFNFENCSFQKAEFFGRGKMIVHSTSKEEQGDSVFKFDMETQKETVLFRNDSGVDLIHSNFDNNLLIATTKKTINLIDTRTKNVSNVFEAHKRTITALDFDLERKCLVSGAMDGSVKIWDIRGVNCTKKIKITQKERLNHPESIKLVRGMGKAAIGFTDGIVKFLNVN